MKFEGRKRARCLCVIYSCPARIFVSTMVWVSTRLDRTRNISLVLQIQTLLLFTIPRKKLLGVGWSSSRSYQETPTLFGAENLLFLELETYVPWIASTTSLIAANITWTCPSIHAQTLSTIIIADTLKQTGWRDGDSRLVNKGINTTSPFAGYHKGDRLIWVMKEVRAEYLDFRRPLTKTKTDCSGVRVVQIFNYVPVPVSHTKLPKISKGTTIHLIIEVLMKADLHHASFAHLPSIGAYEDWRECTCLAVRMEWQTPLGWMSTYLQRIKTQTRRLKLQVHTSIRLRCSLPWKASYTEHLLLGDDKFDRYELSSWHCYEIFVFRYVLNCSFSYLLQEASCRRLPQPAASYTYANLTISDPR